MHIETERKYLVSGSFKHLAHSSALVVQAYICRGSGTNVRVRIYGNKGYITIKTKSKNNGLSRYEWEKEIPLDEARELLSICEVGVIEKTRYL
ncbi:MAG: adenylate cyclase, partial [Paludibacter sp.]|nr:adenylate cyclase [Paludibacter sp.]